MLPLFSKPAQPAPSSAVAPAIKKRSNKPREHDEATKCRIRKYESYRKSCSDQEKREKGSCSMVKKCAKHGVGSELWPVDVWHLDNDKFVAVNERFKDPANPKLRAVDVGKRCMNEVMREDAAFVKTIETECGPLAKKKSSKAKPASSKRTSSKPASKKPAVAAAAPKPASKKPAAVPPAVKK